MITAKVAPTSTHRSLDKKEISIVISFVDDFVTQWAFIGQLFLKRLKAGNRVFRIPGKRDISSSGVKLPFRRRSRDCRGDAVAAMVQSIEMYFHCNPHHTLKRLELTGHGYPAEWAGRLCLDDLTVESSYKRSLLTKLKPYWSEANDGVVLRMCCCAKYEEGRQFLLELAKTIGANVTGWTGVYEIHPTGEEWTATPQGEVFQTGNTRRISHFAAWQQLRGLKKALAFPHFMGCMAWRTISGR